PPPFAPPVPAPPVRHPFQNCDGCNRAFRAPEPGRCRDCSPGGRLA
ncbi:helix-turn-helix domain-containing protein, partial [Streptomyces sp. SID1328]|nr:helix-turn-helix domain-containing protein [Streptomyces sp. SID1328]